MARNASRLMLQMQKIVFVLLLAATGWSLSYSAANAVTPCVPRPGCSCRFYDAVERHADAVRVRNKAYDRQMTKQPDNTMGMNCYDRALVVSSRQGQIFSDTAPAATYPPANYKAWDPSGAVSQKVYDDSAGIGDNPRTGQSKVLSSQYQVVFSKEAQNHASPQNFKDTLSQWLGATIMSFLDGFMGAITGIIAGIAAQIVGIINEFNNLLSSINNILNLIDILGGALPAIVATTVAAIQAIWSTISSTIISAVNTIQSTINGLMTSLRNMIMDAINGFFPSVAPGDDPCARIKRLWNPSSISGQILALLGAVGFRPMEGGGIEQGAPYFDFNSLLTGAIKDPFGTAISIAAATDLTDEIGNLANQPILNAALADLTAGGLLNARQAPGAGVIWPTIPAGVIDTSAFTAPQDVTNIATQLANIISQM